MEKTTGSGVPRRGRKRATCTLEKDVLAGSPRTWYFIDRKRIISHHGTRQAAKYMCFIASTFFIIACGLGNDSGDGGSSQITPPVAEVSVCHFASGRSTSARIAFTALQGHLAHGDYINELYVSPRGAHVEDIEFATISDALLAARNTRLDRGELLVSACRITIIVDAGDYRGSVSAPDSANPEPFPLVIDVPDITLRGAFAMGIDGDNRATGVAAEPGTTLIPSPALASVDHAIVAINGHPGGSAGHRVIVEGFVFQSGRAAGETVAQGLGVLTMRVSDVVIRDSRFETNLASAVDLRASTGTVERIYFSGVGSSCDICFAGPGSYVARGNRLVGGGIPGVLVFPAIVLPVPPSVEQFTLPTVAHVEALVENNEVRGHLAKPVGVGLRVGAVGVGAANVRGSVTATFRNNSLINNTLGVLVEGGFVGASSTGTFIDLTTTNNRITGSCQNDLLVVFSRGGQAYGASPGPSVTNSAFKLTFSGDLDWSRAWFRHIGGLGNTLTVNGETIANGQFHAYDPSRTCAP